MKKAMIRKRVILPLTIILLVALFVQSEWLGRLIYPISYKEEIKKSAQEFQLDPLLIAAIIRVESNFKHEAVSRKGAAGIMQIMPDTAGWILEREEFGQLTVKDIETNPQAGIRMGAWYVKELNRQFKNSLPLSLAAYNAGPGRVRQWLDAEVWEGTEKTLRDIPYGETRHYVQRVLYYYKKYQQYYENL